MFKLHTYDKKRLLSVNFKNEKWASSDDELFIDITQLILSNNEISDNIWNISILRFINTYSTSLSASLKRADNADDTDFFLKEIKDIKFI